MLDASALLAMMFGERGAEDLTAELLLRSVISSVNMAEVQTRLIKSGVDSGVAWADATALVSEISPFTGEQARIAGDLVAETRSLGLSLGDRSCLALGISWNAAVYTADRMWKKLDLSIPIHIIR